jgi:hypothetical protein
VLLPWLWPLIYMVTALEGLLALPFKAPTLCSISPLDTPPGPDAHTPF